MPESLCTQYDAARAASAAFKKRQRAGVETAAMQAYDHEQYWRQAGEYAIRTEMERRLAVYFGPTPRRKGYFLRGKAAS